MKEAVITTRSKDLDNFEGQSKGSTVWFNLDHELIFFSTLEPDFYIFLWEGYWRSRHGTVQKVFVPFDPVKNRASSSDKKKNAKEKVVAQICGIITLPKEYTKTQRVTNGPNMITQSEAPEPEVIVVEKLWSDISVNSWLTGETRASITPENGF